MKKRRLNVDINEDEAAQFKSKCALQQKSMGEKMLEWIRKFLKGDLK